MITYVVYENPDDRILRKASDLLKNGGVICLPTDTNWVFAACPLSKRGVDNLYRVKGVDRKKHLSILCNSISQASQFAIIDNQVYRLVKGCIPGAYTFIFNPTRDLPRVIKSYHGESEIGIRIPDSILCNRLIAVHGDALITTSVSWEMLHEANALDGFNSEIFSYQIEEKFDQHLDMIIDPSYEQRLEASTIVDFSGEEAPTIIRFGAGDATPFQ